MIAITTLVLSLLVQDPLWPGVEVGNWTYLGMSQDKAIMMFVRNPERGRMWVRFEFSADQPVKSERALIEADCTTGRTRPLQRDSFGRPNLLGTSAHIGLGEWTYAAPDTLAESAYVLICNPPPAGYTLR